MLCRGHDSLPEGKAPCDARRDGQDEHRSQRESECGWVGGWVCIQMLHYPSSTVSDQVLKQHCCSAYYMCSAHDYLGKPAMTRNVLTVIYIPHNCRFHTLVTTFHCYTCHHCNLSSITLVMSVTCPSSTGQGTAGSSVEGVRADQ